MLHTPGHSRDCVSLDLVGERLLFGGDTVNTGPVYAQMPDSDVAQLRASLARLAGEAAAWDRVFCSHFLRTEVPPGQYLVVISLWGKDLPEGEIELPSTRMPRTLLAVPVIVMLPPLPLIAPPP